MQFELQMTIGLLGTEWARYRRTFYASVTLGRTTFWLQRWDTERAPDNRFRSRDGVMGWTLGERILTVPMHELRIHVGPYTAEHAEKFRKAGIEVTCVGVEHLHVLIEGFAPAGAFHNVCVALYRTFGSDFGLKSYENLPPEPSTAVLPTSR
jgi:hypothetical protein